MKITSQFISIPPYISTTWGNIVSLHLMQDGYEPTLVIEQKVGSKVEIPNLDGATIEHIFAMHSAILEGNIRPAGRTLQPEGFSSFSVPLPLNMLAEVEKMGTLLEHNPDATDTPELPPEILQRIGGVVQSLGLDDTSAIPQPEMGCNCTFCQIARAIHGDTTSHDTNDTTNVETIDLEEEVSDEDLKFRTWDIDQKGDRLFEVSNPLDKEEQYNVFLGEPIGCTCGHRHCEHVRAVLSS